MAGIYIHIPFCASRCIYCDFYSTTLRGKGAQYVDALAQEMDERKGWLGDAPVRTLYLGGGTPSQLDDENIRLLLEAVGQRFDLSTVEEITMEANPDDIREGQDWGRVNRISMGVQSMVDEELRMLNRRHNAQQVRQAVATLRNQGIGNISLDLMYGLPKQTMESWAYSIDQLLKLKPEHISAYNLSVEEGTRLYNMVQEGELTPADDELCLQMAALLRDRLKAAGYVQYEISNYCLPGFHSRHNSSYWNQTPYLGLGPGAHSYDGRRLRTWNEPFVLKYLHGERQEGREELSDTDLYNERVMLGLRTRWGTPLSPTMPQQVLQKLFAERLIEQVGQHIRLTDAGLALGDEVTRELMLLD